ncbi:MAG TPA: ATP-binding protein, partial [Minicystis sp.]|nr:ATP-binding protein [Minicystis sp.]
GGSFAADAPRALDEVAELAARALEDHVRLARAYARLDDERRAEQRELERGAEALRDANERLAALISASPLAIYSVDAEGRVTSWNPAAERIFGWSTDEALGTVLPFVQEDKLDEFASLRGRMLEGESFTNLALVRTRRDGRRIELSVSTAPLHDARGQTNAIMAVAADVTAQRLVEEQLRQSQKLEALGRLAGGVAHDFNNLLAVVSSYAGLLRGTLAPGDPRVQHVEQIRGAAERAARLTRQLLAFGRKQVLQPVRLDVNATVSSMVQLVQRVIGEDVRLTLDLAPRVAPVLADPTQLEQVLLNLCLNARDAMPDGGDMVISTREEAAEGVLGRPAVVLAVSDTGHGMDEGTRERVFEPFFTTKEHGRGTGLGLATVYGIVQQSGGMIRVDTAPGRGSTFYVHLPQAAGDAPPAASPEPAEPDVGGRGRRVLLVEDEPLVRFVAARILRDGGYVVLEAATPDEALAIARDAGTLIDALVTDVVMPGMNGERLAREIDKLRPGIAVLFVSGYADAALEPTVAFLAKPFTPDALLGAVAGLFAASA